MKSLPEDIAVAISRGRRSLTERSSVSDQGGGAPTDEGHAEVSSSDTAAAADPSEASRDDPSGASRQRTQAEAHGMGMHV